MAYEIIKFLFRLKINQKKIILIVKKHIFPTNFIDAIAKVQVKYILPDP
jgi:hypothetical protein